MRYVAEISGEVFGETLRDSDKMCQKFKKIFPRAIVASYSLNWGIYWGGTCFRGSKNAIF